MSNGSGKTDAPDSFCMVAHPIYISAQDGLTDGTARQILDHDEAGRKLCGWK
jgi:hypothetical protein